MATPPRAEPRSPGASAAGSGGPGADAASPEVSVVLVSYNSAGHIGGCVGSLLADPEAPASEILIVDNASQDESAAIAERIASEHPRVRLLRSPVNRGYAGGVNVALSHARGRYVAVLNMDMEVEPGWLDPLLAELEASPGTAAVCPLMVLLADPGLINAAGQDVHVTGLGFNRLLGRPRADAGSEPFRVSGLHGGAFVIRRDVLDALGGWDESGFLYHEDVQLSWLLQLIGADVRVVPASVVVHDYHLTMHPAKLRLLERNRGAMVLSNLSALSLVALSPLLALTEAMMWGYCLVRGPGFLRAKLSSYGWILRHLDRIRERRRLVRSLRRRPDRQILRQLRWGYPWDQFLHLGREHGLEARREIPHHHAG
ncbi:MAG: glycosyltransferase family 2 protein [Solirubrobacterales bacterium]